MSISIFDVAGPVMVGPSSSHTAGAAKLARAAAALVGTDFDRVRFGLSGSFARTGQGHGTDKALVAGVLGMPASDERLPHSFEIARERGLDFSFYNEDIQNAHENTVRISFSYHGQPERVVEGFSAGGGRICITGFEKFDTVMYCDNPTAAIIHIDRPGVLSGITAAFAACGMNIALLRCARLKRGDISLCTVETDEPIPEHMVTWLRKVVGVVSVGVIDPEDWGAEI